VQFLAWGAVLAEGFDLLVLGFFLVV